MRRQTPAPERVAKSRASGRPLEFRLIGGPIGRTGRDGVPLIRRHLLGPSSSGPPHTGWECGAGVWESARRLSSAPPLSLRLSARPGRLAGGQPCGPDGGQHSASGTALWRPSQHCAHSRRRFWRPGWPRASVKLAPDVSLPNRRADLRAPPLSRRKSTPFRGYAIRCALVTFFVRGGQSCAIHDSVGPPLKTSYFESARSSTGRNLPH